MLVTKSINKNKNKIKFSLHCNSNYHLISGVLQNASEMAERKWSVQSTGRKREIFCWNQGGKTMSVHIKSGPNAHYLMQHQK